MFRPKSVVVLEALLMGIPCRLGMNVYVLDEHNRLCLKTFDENGQERPELALSLAGDLHNFIHLCNAAAQDEISIIAMNIAHNTKRG